MRTFVEYFAGIGLVREGLSQAGWAALFANDIDPKKETLYVANFGDQDFKREDIYKLNADEIPSSLLATASFPCTDLSLAGNRRGLEGEHSGTFWGFFRILEGMGPRRPPLVMLENVPGFLSSKGGSDFIAVIKALNDLGYRCDAFQVDAVNFVPQSRARVFVVGALGDVMPALVMESSSRSEALRPKALMRLLKEYPELNWGETALPDLPKRARALPDILEDIPEDSPLWWSQEAVDKLLGQMSDRHRAQAQKMAVGDHFSYGTVYRRIREGTTRAELRTDGIAGALRTPRGGSSKQFLLAAGRGKTMVRTLTGREYGRLQGVDDGYKLDCVTDNHARFGFGDAVCVPAIKWIGDNCLNPLAEKVVRTLATA